jgi:hypothetical protein
MVRSLFLDIDAVVPAILKDKYCLLVILNSSKELKVNFTGNEEMFPVLQYLEKTIEAWKNNFK